MPEAAEAPAVSRHRGLTPERERELLRVTAEPVGEVGYDGVTMAAVAQRAKCGTATLNRRGESKPRLVISAWKAQGSDHGTEVGTDVDDSAPARGTPVPC
ncbi:TetR/AcrR family transcriptional regulator [Streptomyces qinzhouensis]|uniref:TetR family transcriptional regulator n=1 Tax=Streptomyces qinzhouensis TaxID=2599401 RepID=A0A5B8JET4_9ACTN|nr:TetR family transcriptional regulator [Streptomyces qinzhouensis]QDY80285.1 TetR family transcriptional regulator [Streptomyces qinzhouensis]